LGGVNDSSALGFRRQAAQLRQLDGGGFRDRCVRSVVDDIERAAIAAEGYDPDDLAVSPAEKLGDNRTKVR